MRVLSMSSTLRVPLLIPVTRHHRQCREQPVLARCRLEQPADFLDTQHRWQFAWIARQDQAPRQIRPVERYVKKKRSAETEPLMVGGCTPLSR